jgi:hypothetical protein
MDHGRVARSTVDRWWHGREDARARRCAHRSLASGHSGVWKLVGEGAEERGEHREPILGLTRAQAVLWRLGDDGEATAERKLSGSGARAQT